MILCGVLGNTHKNILCKMYDDEEYGIHVEVSGGYRLDEVYIEWRT